MMRRIDLLPGTYAAKRAERRKLGLVIVAGMVIFGLLVGYWVLLGRRVGEAEDELTSVQARNQQLQQQIAELQRFADLQVELGEKQAALAAVMAGDLDWPALLTEIAMVIPPETWLTSIIASSGLAEGGSQVPTETAEIRLSDEEVFGRIQFQGSSQTMPGVAKWLIRLASMREFAAVFLNQASLQEGIETGTVVTFDNTAELTRRATSKRFEGGTR